MIGLVLGTLVPLLLLRQAWYLFWHPAEVAGEAWLAPYVRGFALGVGLRFAGLLLETWL